MFQFSVCQVRMSPMLSPLKVSKSPSQYLPLLLPLLLPVLLPSPLHSPLARLPSHTQTVSAFWFIVLHHSLRSGKVNRVNSVDG